MRITGRSVTDKERTKLSKIAKEIGADEITIGVMEAYDGFKPVWRTVARFFKDGKLIRWISWE